MNKVSKNLSFWFSLQLICYSFYSTFCSQFSRSYKCKRSFNNFYLKLFHKFFLVINLKVIQSVIILMFFIVKENFIFHKQNLLK